MRAQLERGVPCMLPQVYAVHYLASLVGSQRLARAPLLVLPSKMAFHRSQRRSTRRCACDLDVYHDKAQAELPVRKVRTGGGTPMRTSDGGYPL